MYKKTIDTTKTPCDNQNMETKLLQLPMPIELRDRLKKLAEKNKRSMTAHAIYILEREINHQENVLNGKTQINMPADPESAERAMERIR